MKRRGSSQLAFGAVLLEGTEHRTSAKGLQDSLNISSMEVPNTASLAFPTGAHSVTRGEGGFVGVVCDGTSNVSLGIRSLESRNQVGAQLAAVVISRAIASTFPQALAQQPTFESALSAVLQHAERGVYQVARYISKKAHYSKCGKARDMYRAFVAGHFSFTVLGFVIQDPYFAVFGLGDGAFSINGEIRRKRSQSLLCNRLLGAREDGRLITHVIGDSAKLDSLWIATDGIEPGLHVASISQLDEFVNDPLTCARNAGCEDTTTQAFRKHLHYRFEFNDDLAMVVAKRIPTTTKHRILEDSNELA